MIECPRCHGNCVVDERDDFGFDIELVCEICRGDGEVEDEWGDDRGDQTS